VFFGMVDMLSTATPRGVAMWDMFAKFSTTGGGDDEQI
jgi:hypothetical protein